MSIWPMPYIHVNVMVKATSAVCSHVQWRGCCNIPLNMWMLLVQQNSNNQWSLWNKQCHTHTHTPCILCEVLHVFHKLSLNERREKDDAIPCCACTCTHTCCEAHTLAVHARATKPWCTLFPSFHSQLAAAGVVYIWAWNFIRCAIILHMQLYRSEHL